jgi:hypothetical protein
VIGSANLTFNGLHNNIEASASIELDLSDQDQKAFFESTNTAFTTMVADYPKHVFAITSASQADELCESGRLADETIVPALPAPSVLMTGNRDDLPRMGLHLTPPPRKKAKPTTTKAPTATKPSAAVGKAAPRPSGYYLVWESKPLSARDLSIPRAKSTNPTGSMGLKKGTFDNIDQRHYFRDDVFVDLNWKIEPAGSIWERARARFDLVVKDLNYGPFNLQLSHNTDTTSATYKQNNFMTQLHWGKALVHVAKDDLLGRTLRLYREDNAPPRFLIEID